MTTQDENAVHDTLLEPKVSGYVLAYASAAIFNALLVVLKESVESVQALMASLGHHWVTQGALDLIVFFGIAFYFTAAGKRITGDAAVNYLIWSTIVGGGIIAGFFLFNYF
jgi:hypothetical protein